VVMLYLWTCTSVCLVFMNSWKCGPSSKLFYLPVPPVPL